MKKLKSVSSSDIAELLVPEQIQQTLFGLSGVLHASFLERKNVGSRFGV